MVFITIVNFPNRVLIRPRKQYYHLTREELSNIFVVITAYPYLLFVNNFCIVLCYFMRYAITESDGCRKRMTAICQLYPVPGGVVVFLMGFLSFDGW